MQKEVQFVQLGIMLIHTSAGEKPRLDTDVLRRNLIKKLS